MEDGVENVVKRFGKVIKEVLIVDFEVKIFGKVILLVAVVEVAPACNVVAEVLSVGSLLTFSVPEFAVVLLMKSVNGKPVVIVVDRSNLDDISDD